MSAIARVARQLSVWQGFQLNRWMGTATLIERDSSYSALTDDDVSTFKSILGEQDVITDADALAQYNR